ncbi:LexA family protein [Hathewaya massiliensis]|uniref:LexA family protein n=1 Tax=Hathewaya massiliensis TaxID=1964382 RepID=UPI001158522A|nr:LexA family transcriptional regulator [Hathewaya massiliensis]
MFLKQQYRVIKDKNMGTKIIKGTLNSGKTTAALSRALFLKDNYSLYSEDRILYLVSEKKKLNYINEKLDELKGINTPLEFSFFSILGRDVELYDIENLSLELYKELFPKEALKFKILSNEEDRKKIITETYHKFKVENQGLNRIKIFREDNIEAICEEIKFIKLNNINSLEEYKTIKRRGKAAKLSSIRKNSKTREAIYYLFKEYNKVLNSLGYVEYEDILHKLIEKNLKSFVHIIVDHCEKLSPMELQFLNSIYNPKPYSERIFILHSMEDKGYSALISGKRLNLKSLGKIQRRYNFKEEIIEDKDNNLRHSKEIGEYINQHNGKDTESKSLGNHLRDLGNNSMDLENNSRDLMEHFKFVDLRHNREFDFKRDYSDINDIIVCNGSEEEEYEIDELKEVPMFTNIAAGEPIMISSEQEGLFFLPKYWIKGMKDCFMLKVRGDSMIDANIENGDYVIIRQQFNAENKDIVAVDLGGNATLKRLYVDKKEVLLLPENKAYSPIVVNEEEGISILGVAIGIVKKL